MHITTFTHSYYYITDSVIDIDQSDCIPLFNRLYHENPIMLYSAIQGGFDLNRVSATGLPIYISLAYTTD